MVWYLRFHPQNQNLELWTLLCRNHLSLSRNAHNGEFAKFWLHLHERLHDPEERVQLNKPKHDTIYKTEQEKKTKCKKKKEEKEKRVERTSDRPRMIQICRQKPQIPQEHPTTTREPQNRAVRILISD